MLLARLLIVLVIASVSEASAALYKCPQSDGSSIYTDRVIASGCQEFQPPAIIQENNSLVPTDKLTTPEPTQAVPVFPPRSKAKRAITFPANDRLVQALGYIPPASVFDFVPSHSALPGTITPVTITVKPLADGSGPQVRVSSKFGATWQQSARQAAMLAAQVVNLDPAVLSVDFTIVANYVALLSMGNTDGPSAGGLLTVGVVAALLDDPIDPSVCMTGTIQPDLTIGPIAAIPQKMLGCKEMKATRILIPYGQTDAEVRRSSVDTGIQVIEVRSLTEAYELVTGKPLRKLTGS